MKPLANFIMRGYSQAALVAAMAALLSLLMPLLGPISAAAVGLVTLRSGGVPGLLVVGLATLGASVLSALALGSPWPAFGILAVFWMPIWILAIVLRSSRSLVMAVQLAVMFGLTLVFALHAFVGDPAAYWLQLLEPFQQALVNDSIVQADVSQALFSELAKWMTGSFAAALVVQTLAGLFIARWWQAALYNPGGFGAEFKSFRLRRIVGIPILLLLVLLGFERGAGLVADIVLVLGILLVLQGLAVAHGVRQIAGARVTWIVSLYVLLVLFMPQALFLTASVGLIDIWADIRARVARRAKSLG
ncbi:hypothetical protein CCR95_16770 [Thiocystis minor]|nr:hypothetical protein [Thiocystis minor]MBK5965692.1 hypothetical protein [Thiocystis minor]